MRMFLKPTRTCPEHDLRPEGWELTVGKTFGFKSALGQAPEALKAAETHYLGWLYVPGEYFLGVSRGGDDTVHVDGFRKYGYGIFREGFEDTGELKGRTRLDIGDTLYLSDGENRPIRELKFKLTSE